MQSRSPVQNNWIFGNNLIENVPNLLSSFLHHLTSTFYGGNVSFIFEFVIYKGLEKLQSHFLGNTALMESQMRTDYDNRTPRVIYTFSQKILPETTLFTFQHVRKRFQRTFVASRNHSAPPAVVKQNINSLLQHSLLIADDDIRGIKFQQPFESVVSVNHPSVKIV